MKKYHVAYIALITLTGFVDVSTAAGSGGTTFLTKSLCGPVLAWIAALFLPAETIQTRLMAVVNKE